MEYQKIVNLLNNESDQPSKFRTRNWIEINDKSRGNCANGDIKFKTTILRSNLCDYADSYILVKGTITITGAGDINRINNADIDIAQDIDIMMLMYNLIEYSDNYSKTSGGLWQYYKDDPNYNLTDSESFKSKVRKTGKTPNNGNTKHVEITVPLKYFRKF